MVGGYAHRHVHLLVHTVFLAGQFGNLVDQRGKYVGVVVRLFPLQGHAKALEAHAGVYHLGGQRLQMAVGLTVILHEHQVPYLDYLGIVLVYERSSIHFIALLVAAQVDVNFRTGTAGTRVAHFPEIIVTVSVDDVAFGQMLLPDGSGLVIALQTFGSVALEYGGVQTLGIEFQYVHEIFPGEVDGLFLEIIAERPVAKHLEHGVMISVVTHFLKVVVLARHAKALLAVGHALRLGDAVAQYNILELVHARVGEHQGGVVFQHHRC